MRKSFEEILGLSADEFAAYFNNRVLEALGRAGAGAHLTRDERRSIGETRRDLYEKIEKARDRRLTAAVEAIYPELEEAHIKAAKEALGSELDIRATEGGAAAAPARETSPADSLNPDSVRAIASYLLPQDQLTFAQASKSLNTDLKGTLNPVRARAVKKFLHHVARGQQAEAEVMLRADRSLLTEFGEFTDYSGRRFICSAYEYAYWAKDKHMCNSLAQVDAEGRSHLDEETKVILRQRINRMEELDPTTHRARGLVYWQNGATHHSAHFDLTPLITALQDYVNGFDIWYTIYRGERMHNWPMISAAWAKVGLAQREVPAHVAQEYCRADRSFSPTPTFTEATLPRVLAFQYLPDSSYGLWFPLGPEARLGVDFSFTRESGSREARAIPVGLGGAGPADASTDLAALRRLDEVRTADLTLLRDHLNPPATAPGLGR